MRVLRSRFCNMGWQCMQAIPLRKVHPSFFSLEMANNPNYPERCFSLHVYGLRYIFSNGAAYSWLDSQSLVCSKPCTLCFGLFSIQGHDAQCCPKVAGLVSLQFSDRRRSAFPSLAPHQLPPPCLLLEIEAGGEENCPCAAVSVRCKIPNI